MWGLHILIMLQATLLQVSQRLKKYYANHIHNIIHTAYMNFRQYCLLQ